MKDDEGKQVIAEQIEKLESWTPPTRSRLGRNTDNTKDFYQWYQPKCDAMKQEVLSGKLTAQQTQEARRQINLFLRRCQKYLVLEQNGCHYIEQVEDEKGYTEEHLIPQNLLIDAYIDGLLSFNDVLCMPMVKLSNRSDKLLQEEGLGTKTPSWKNPFERYIQAGIESEFVTQHNYRVNIYAWSLEKHFEMVEQTKKNFDKLLER